VTSADGVAAAHVDYELRDGVAYITLNRPEVRNALSDEVIRQLRQLLIRMDDDDGAFVGVLSGNGKVFSSGADIKQRQLRPKEELRRLGGPEARDARSGELPYGFVNWKPLIAAVHGYAMGAGLYLALMCDLIVAAEGTQFQITETVRGTDSTRYLMVLAERSALGFATDVALTGRFFTAEEAKRAGAIDRLVAPGRHLEEATTLARTILELPPLAVRQVVEARRGINEEVELRARLRRSRTLHLTDDFRESASSFVEKRQARYGGR
jgi:enoyl-CoA hydratase/carnithine racemase